jgi:hypothetical protein
MGVKHRPRKYGKGMGLVISGTEIKLPKLAAVSAMTNPAALVRSASF